MDPVLPTLSILGYRAIVLDSVEVQVVGGNAGWSEGAGRRPWP